MSAVHSAHQQRINDIASRINNVKRRAINGNFIGSMMLNISSCIHIGCTSKAALTGVALNFAIGQRANSYGLAPEDSIIDIHS